MDLRTYVDDHSGTNRWRRFWCRATGGHNWDFDAAGCCYKGFKPWQPTVCTKCGTSRTVASGLETTPRNATMVECPRCHSTVFYQQGRKQQLCYKCDHNFVLSDAFRYQCYICDTIYRGYLDECPNCSCPTGYTGFSCPACGSNKLEGEEVGREYAPPFGETVKYTLTIQRCGDCGEAGDFVNQNGPIVRQIIWEANLASVPRIVWFLRKYPYLLYGGSSQIDKYIENALKVPRGTLIRWEGKDITKEELALLWLLRSDPRLIDIANNGYEPLDE